MQDDNIEKESNLQDAIIKDLEIQWKDHHHMRDQTWKTLTISVLFFLGIIGLEIRNVGNFVMIPSYTILIFIAFIGWAIAAHHRVRQGQKFSLIKMYEEKLGLYEFKRSILEGVDAKSGIAGKIFTARFIEIIQTGMGLVAFTLLLRRMLFA
ncbi:hypothetical protein ACFLSS_02575 [Bacteroidota bacterium]